MNENVEHFFSRKLLVKNFTGRKIAGTKFFDKLKYTLQKINIENVKLCDIKFVNFVSFVWKIQVGLCYRQK